MFNFKCDNSELINWAKVKTLLQQIKEIVALIIWVSVRIHFTIAFMSLLHDCIMIAPLQYTVMKYSDMIAETKSVDVS
jgi:hypothetical protein